MQKKGSKKKQIEANKESISCIFAVPDSLEATIIPADVKENSLITLEYPINVNSIVFTQYKNRPTFLFGTISTDQDKNNERINTIFETPEIAMTGEILVATKNHFTEKQLPPKKRDPTPSLHRKSSRKRKRVSKEFPVEVTHIEIAPGSKTKEKIIEMKNKKSKETVTNKNEQPKKKSSRKPK